MCEVVTINLHCVPFSDDLYILIAKDMIEGKSIAIYSEYVGMDRSYKDKDIEGIFKSFSRSFGRGVQCIPISNGDFLEIAINSEKQGIFKFANGELKKEMSTDQFNVHIIKYVRVENGN